MDDKQYDLFADVLTNKDHTIEDLIIAGRTAENTDLKDFDYYKKNSWVQEQFKDQNGNFDEETCKKVYDNVAMYYNNLANIDRDQVIQSQISYGANNIFAPEEQRRKLPEFFRVQTLNPLRLVTSFVSLGRQEDPIWSVDEVALDNKVLVNPTTAGDNLENAIWDERPTGHLGHYFWDTLVLSVYENDGVHKDPITGELVEHKKGDLRLNDKGEFFYEKLDGRSIYGRLVLHKLNILTEDHTKINDYDFFDTDGIEEKSFVGATVRNLALVGSMFLPWGIGTVVTAATLGVALTGLGATLGKMLLGSDSPNLSAVEGWVKGFSRQTGKTEYAQLHFWCWENMINLIGDFCEIPRTLEFIFQKVPMLFKGGKNLMDKDVVKAQTEKWIAARKAFNDKKIEAIKDSKGVLSVEYAAMRELNAEEVLYAQALQVIQPATESYMRLGEVLSRGYMALHIASETYGEAKAAGATDRDATMLTLGYTAVLYKFLGLGISKWIFPELRAEGMRTKAIAKALTDMLNADLKAVVSNFAKATPLDKLARVVKLFNIGKKLAYGDYALGTRTLSSVLAGGIGMGVEGTGFEFLSDLSKGCYDVVKYLLGDDHRLETFGYDFDTKEWHLKDTLSGYGLNFFTAVIGGSLTSVWKTYKMVRDNTIITTDQALQQVVYMCRNGKIDEFMKLVNKIELGNKHLSSKVILDNGKTYIYAKGTKENNQDKELKDHLKRIVSVIDSIVHSKGAALSDESLIDKLTLLDIRLSRLANNTKVLGLFLQKYNSLEVQKVKLYNELNGIYSRAKDTNKNGKIEDGEDRHNGLSKDDLQAIAKKEEEIKAVEKEIERYKSGDMAYEFSGAVMYAMSPILNNDHPITSIEAYTRAYRGKDYNKLSPIDKHTVEQAYKSWLEGGTARSDTLVQAAAFRLMLEKLAEVLRTHADTYKKGSEKAQLALAFLKQLTAIYDSISNPEMVKKFSALLPSLGQQTERSKMIIMLNAIVDSFGSEAQKTLYEEILKSLLEYREKEKKGPLSAEENRIQTEKAQEQIKLSSEILRDNLEQAFNELTYAPEELKNALQTISKRVGGVLFAYSQEADNPLEFILLNSAWAEIVKKVQSLPESPIMQFLNEFQSIILTENGKTVHKNITEVLQSLNQLYNDTSFDVAQFKLDDANLQQAKEALSILYLYKSAVEASRTDNAGLVNPFGYAAVVNEVGRKLGFIGEGEGKHVELAEIDMATADRILADIDTNASKLQYLLALAQANLGNKLGAQDRIATKEDVAIYKRAVTVFSSLDKDDPLASWEGITELLGALGDVSLLNSIDPTEPISEDLKKILLEERIKVEDAIKTFFDKNADKVKDPKKLAELINPMRFTLFDTETTTVDDSLKVVDDVSFLWFLCSRAAVKSSDFYGRWAEILSEDIKAGNPKASLSVLERAVYMNYASVVNGDMFTNFFNAFRYSCLRAWKGSSEEQKIEILRKLGYTEEDIKNILIQEKDNPAQFLQTIFSRLSVPTYANFMFNDAVAGAGKSSMLLPQTIKMLAKYHRGTLENVIIIHGGTLESADALRDKLGIPNSEAYGIEEFTDEFIPNYRKLVPSGDLSKMPSTSFEFADGEIVSKVQVKKAGTRPTLIIIDEVQRANVLQTEAIQKIAKENGITVLAFGDFDLTGVFALTNVTIGSTRDNIVLFNSTSSFMHTSKIGVSMRTDNLAKSWNQAALRLRMKDPTQKEPTSLKYYIDPKNPNEGFYGDISVEFDTSKVEESIMGNEDAQSFVGIVHAMIVSLKSEGNESQKIGFICENPNSALGKFLQDTFGEDKIELYTLGAAAGKEGQYYIIEVANDSPESLKAVYTGMTRASLGSIIVKASGDYQNLRFNNLYVPHKVDEPINNAYMTTYTADRQKTLSELFPTPGTIPFIPREGANTSLHEEVKSDDNNIKTVPKRQAITKKTTDTKTVADDSKKSEATTTGNKDTEEKTTTGDEGKAALSDDIEPSQPDLDWDHPSKDVPVKGSSLHILAVAKDGKIYRRITGLTSYLEGLDQYYDVEFDGISEEEATNGHPIISYDADMETDSLGKVIKKGKLRFTKNPEEGTATESIESTEADTEETSTSAPVEPPVENVENGNTDDYAPEFINGGIETNEEATHYVSNLNENTNSGASQAEALVQNESGVYDIDTLIHTFNTHDIGIRIENGKIVIDDPKLFAARIDGANGLLKLILGTGPVEDRMSLSEINTVMAELWDALVNISDKQEMIKVVLSILNELNNSAHKADIPLDICINFAYKTCASQKEKSSIKSPTQPSPFAKDGEKTQFNGSEEEGEPHYKTLVAVIGSRSLGYFLEIPLMAFSSPITVMQHFEEFLPVNEVFRAVISKGGTINDAVREVLKYHNEHKEEWKPYQKLIRMFRDYADNSTSNNIIFITDAKGDGTLNLQDVVESNGYSNNKKIAEQLDSSTWTPAKAFELVGARAVNERGRYQVTEQYLYEAVKTEIGELKKNPRMHISEKVYVATDDVPDADGHIIIERGNCFILVSHDSTITGDKEMFEQYKRLQKGAARKVELVYVLSPKATITQYINKLDAHFTKRGTPDDIGGVWTSYQILKILLSDKDTRDAWKKHFNYTSNATRKAKYFGEQILRVVEELAGLEREEKYEELNLKLSEHNQDIELLLKSIKADSVSTSFTFPTSLQSLSDFFAFCLWLFCGKGRSNQRLQAMERLIPDGINYNPKLDHSGDIGEISPMKTDSNYCVLTTDGPKSYVVNGKIDSYMFRADIDPILQAVESNTMKNDRGYSRSPDMDFYLANVRKWNSKFNPDGTKTEKAPIPTATEKPVTTEKSEKEKQAEKVEVLKLQELIREGISWNDKGDRDLEKCIIVSKQYNDDNDVVQYSGILSKIASFKYLRIPESMKFRFHDFSDFALLYGYDANNTLRTVMISGSPAKYIIEYDSSGHLRAIHRLQDTFTERIYFNEDQTINSYSKYDEAGKETTITDPSVVVNIGRRWAQEIQSSNANLTERTEQRFHSPKPLIHKLSLGPDVAIEKVQLSNGDEIVSRGRYNEAGKKTGVWEKLNAQGNVILRGVYVNGEIALGLPIEEYIDDGNTVVRREIPRDDREVANKVLYISQNPLPFNEESRTGSITVFDDIPVSSKPTYTPYNGESMFKIPTSPSGSGGTLVSLGKQEGSKTIPFGKLEGLDGVDINNIKSAQMTKFEFLEEEGIYKATLLIDGKAFDVTKEEGVDELLIEDREDTCNSITINI